VNPTASSASADGGPPDEPAGIAKKLTEGLIDTEPPGALTPPVEIEPADFGDEYGETLSRTLDLDTWSHGEDLTGVFERLDREVSEALKQEDQIRRHIRELVFPVIATRDKAPKDAGVYQATVAQIKAVQENVLFNGGVEACDGTISMHETLPLTIAQIGVCLVSYAGEQGSWVQRLYRRDLRARGKDPVKEAIAVLERRETRSGMGQPDKHDQLKELARRGIMSYSERAVLLDKATAPWRMGHGHPAPYELLTGSGSMDLLHRGLEVLSRLILDQRRFVYVPSAAAERVLLTLGNALRPLEFAIVATAEARMHPIIFEGHLRGKHREKAIEFYHEVAPRILVGMYRTSMSVPPQIFYAHVDHAQEAALIAMADSVLQAHRGFPILIDVADGICRSSFASDFASTVQSAYAAGGSALNYLPERETRR
jgi:hypothetical protein